MAPADALGLQYPDAPFDLNGNQSYVEVFSRRFMPRWDATDQLIPEDPNNYFSLYSVGNIEVNPILLQAGGTNLLALSLSGDRSDNRLALDLIDRWGSRFINMNGEYVNVNDGYRQLITSIGTRTSSNMNFVNEQSILVEKANDKRSYIMGVSLDEELRNMMIYQHAYNASARIVNVVDSMLDRLINGTGA
jgi:flagellar hook-associated protein 1 FlgK